MLLLGGRCDALEFILNPGVAVFGTVDALEKEIATAQKICDDAGNVVPYPPHARGYKETLAKMVSEAGVFKKKDALLASNDLVEVENANAELKRLKVGGTHVFIGHHRSRGRTDCTRRRCHNSSATGSWHAGRRVATAIHAALVTQT